MARVCRDLATGVRRRPAQEHRGLERRRGSSPAPHAGGPTPANRPAGRYGLGAAGVPRGGGVAFGSGVGADAGVGSVTWLGAADGAMLSVGQGIGCPSGPSAIVPSGFSSTPPGGHGPRLEVGWADGFGDAGGAAVQVVAGGKGAPQPGPYGS
jgi:hypothetical protein